MDFAREAKSKLTKMIERVKVAERDVSKSIKRILASTIEASKKEEA